MDFLEYVRNVVMYAIVFYFFFKNMPCVFLRTFKFWVFLQKSKVFPKMCYLRKYAVVGCKSMDTFGCMSMPFGCLSMPFGCMSMDRLGACMRLLGAKSAATFGCMPDSR